MVRIQKVGFLAVAAIFSIATCGCACLRDSKYSQYSDAPSGVTFFSPNPSFSEYASLSNLSVSEYDKIDYLLDRVAASDQRFIRNGEFHDGKIARRWLLYKMTHWVSGVGTAQDFVSRVASYSQKTGKPYLVKLPDGRLYSLSSVLKNELSLFEANLGKLEEFRKTHPPQQPSPTQVSLSPTAVATAAVATSTS